MEASLSLSPCRQTHMSANGLGHPHAAMGAIASFELVWHLSACTLFRSLHSCFLPDMPRPSLSCHICGAEIHTAILVICLCPFLLYCDLLALSTSGLPTKALWLAPHLTPRAAMVSEDTIPETMVTICRTLSRYVCPYCGELQSSSAGPHLPSSIAGRQNRQSPVCVHAYDGVLALLKTPSAIMLARKCPTEKA